jgi:uncharacterized membrane protein YfhO
MKAPLEPERVPTAIYLSIALLCHILGILTSAVLFYKHMTWDHIYLTMQVECVIVFILLIDFISISLSVCAYIILCAFIILMENGYDVYAAFDTTSIFVGGVALAKQWWRHRKDILQQKRSQNADPKSLVC